MLLGILWGTPLVSSRDFLVTPWEVKLPVNNFNEFIKLMNNLKLVETQGLCPLLLKFATLATAKIITKTVLPPFSNNKTKQ